MQRIVDETSRRGRFVTRFVAAACLLSLVTACGTDDAVAPTPPRAVIEPQGVSKLLELSTAFDIYAFPPLTPDVGGANDYSGQNDLNVFTRADNVTGKLGVAWTWDDINSWEGTGQTGDACALFDTDPIGTLPRDGGGNADYAVCVRINNPEGAGSDPTQLPQPQSPLIYQCGDSKTDRCTTTFSILPLGGSFCEVYKSAENFPAGDDGFDVLAGCSINLSAVGNPSRSSFLNVCSFPSGSPNSNPFDCVVTPGSGFVQIKKKTSPQTSGLTFSFTLNPASSNNTTVFNIVDNSANDETTALIPVAPGTFSVTESTIPSGWALTAASCTGAGTNGSKSGNAVTGIVIAVGETAVCTFENTQSGSITIVKDATPNDAQDFAFTGNITDCTSFTLDDDAGATGENTTNASQKTCNVAPGTYNVDETVPPNWVKNSATCSDGSPITAIAVSAGESVTCTFNNTKNGSIIIVKDAVPNDLQDFAFTGNITGCTSFTLDDDFGVASGNDTRLNQITCAVVPGTYNVDESPVASWTKSASCSDLSPITSIVVSAGETVTCTFTNTKDAVLKLVKKLSPTNDPGKFDLTIAGTTYMGAGNAGFGHDGNTGFAVVAAGAVSFSEAAHTGTTAADYTTALECRNAADQVVTSNPNGTNTAGSVTVSAGDQITCTFTNTRTQGSIELKKVWVHETGVTTLRIGSTANGSEVTSKVTSTGLSTGAQTVNTGTYYVSETGGLDDYTSALECTDNGGTAFTPVNNALPVANGHVVVCTFTNTRKRGTIELKKVWVHETGVTTLRIGSTANGSEVASKVTSTGLSTGAQTVNTGTYYVSETGGLGDYNAALECTDNGGTAFTPANNALTVENGHAVVCTFTNTRKRGSIKVDKVWVGPGGSTTLKIGTSAGGSEVKSQATGSAGAAPLTTGAQTVNTGTYYVSETGGLTDYTTDLSCVNGATPVVPGTNNSVNVTEGSNIVCTFTNTRKPNLALTKTPDRDGTGYRVAPGDPASFTIKLTNVGGGTATAVEIVDTLPDVKANWTDDQAACGVTVLPGETFARALSCTLTSLGTGAEFIVVVTATIPSDALVKPATDPSPGLEIDGNLVKDGTTSQDWATLGINCESTPKVGCAIDLASGSLDNSFGNGTKEDTPVPSIVTGGIPNNKSDLLRLYVANQRIVTTDHLYLAWERVQEPTGSTNMDFELNQSNQVHPNGLPVRSEGDVLITYDLAQGGAVADLGFHRWILSGTCGGNGSKAPCWGPRQELTEDVTQNFAGTINGAPVTDPINPGAPRSLSARTFGEARINLKDSGIFLEGICTVFGKAYLKSRSSDSFSAAVKDFIFPVSINVSNCEEKELKNEAKARASNFAPSGGSLNAWFADSGWILITDEPAPTPPDFLTQSTVQEVANAQISAAILRSKEVGSNED